MVFHEYADSNGKRLAFVRCNDWSDEVILFFHGFTGSKEYFPDYPDIKKCILSFDRPGIGESSVQEYYSMENHIENIYEVLKSHNVSSVRLIGHSAGGYYAQLFAQMYPQIVKSLSLVSSMVPLNCRETKGFIKGEWKLISFLSLKAKKISRLFFKQMAKSIIEEYDEQLADNLKSLSDIEKEFMIENPELIRNAITQAVANEGAGVFFDAYALCQKRTNLEISKDIPVFVWHGTGDKTLPISFVDYFVSKYSVAKVNKIENVGHMLYLPYWKKIIEEIS